MGQESGCRVGPALAAQPGNLARLRRHSRLAPNTPRGRGIAQAAEMSLPARKRLWLSASLGLSQLLCASLFAHAPANDASSPRSSSTPPAAGPADARAHASPPTN